MRQKIKRWALLFIPVVMILTAGIVIFNNRGEAPVSRESIASAAEDGAILPGAISTIAKVRTDGIEKPHSGGKTTLEDLRKEYPNIEIIQLYSGEIFSGAVIAADETFTLMTVNGEVRFSREEIKQRRIIR